MNDKSKDNIDTKQATNLQFYFIKDKKMRCLLEKKFKDANLCIKDYPFNSWILYGFTLEGLF